MSEAVQSVQRVLHLLTIMNQREVWPLADLVRASGLAKTTVHRLLQTLESEGYVHNISGRVGLYRLTTRTEALSRGLTAATRYAEASDPLVLATTQAIDWPVSFGLPETLFIRIVSCGMPFSPEHSAKATSVGASHWMFSSAVGRAFLSRCSREKITTIQREGEAFRDSSSVELVVPSLEQVLGDSDDVRERGYALRIAKRGDVNAALAVPVYKDDLVIGALACSTFPHSLSDGFIARMKPGLLLGAAQIAEACLRG